MLDSDINGVISATVQCSHNVFPDAKITDHT